MRTRATDRPFSDETGAGRLSLADHDGHLRLTIDTTTRGQRFTGVPAHALLTEAEATWLRDALDAWLRRNDPDPR